MLEYTNAEFFLWPFITLIYELHANVTSGDMMHANLSWQPNRCCNVSVLTSSVVVDCWFEPQSTIKLVFVAIPLSMQHWRDRAKIGWLGFRILYPSWATCPGTDPGGGTSPKIGKNMIFCVKSWFFTRNTPNIFAPSTARRDFFKCAYPPNLKSWIRAWYLPVDLCFSELAL